MKKITQIALLAGAALASSTALASADKLTFYCSAQEEWCQVMANGFQDATGIEVNMTRKSSGETFAQIKADLSENLDDWMKQQGDEGQATELRAPERQTRSWKQGRKAKGKAAKLAPTK